MVEGAQIDWASHNNVIENVSEKFSILIKL